MANTPYTTTAPSGLESYLPVDFNYNLADIAAGDILVDYVIPFGFKLARFDVVVSKAATTAGKAATVAVKIDGTAVTGASLALTSANMTPIGAVLTTTPTDVLSGGNNQSALTGGSKLRLTASSVTAFVEGAVSFVLWLQSLEG